MNIIILAGGYAKRLWPLTVDYPKTLLRIAGRPTLYHLLENLSHVPNADNLIIAVDSDKKQFFIDEIINLNIVSKVRPRLSIHEAESDGAIKGPLKKLCEIIDAANNFDLTNDDFLVVGGDNVFGFDLSDFCSFYQVSRKSCNVIQKFVEPTDISQFGVPALDERGRLISFIEKPTEPKYKLISTACYIFRSSDIYQIKNYLKTGEEDGLGDFIRWLITRVELVGYQCHGKWYDIGSREGILAANGFLMQWKQEKRKEPELVYGRTEIIPPVYIEETATITDSTVGPNVYIGSRTKIMRSNIQNSIVYDNCKVQDCNLRNSVVGNTSIVEGNITEAVIGPRTHIVTEAK